MLTDDQEGDRRPRAPAASRRSRDTSRSPNRAPRATKPTMREPDQLSEGLVTESLISLPCRGCLPFEVERLQPRKMAASARTRDCERRALELARAALEARRRCSSGSASAPGSSSSSWNADPLVRARRHRRQYADHAGPRPAPRPGLVRPSPVPAEPAARREHPLVAAGRSADRRADPRASAVPRRRRRPSAGRSRSRRCCRICCCCSRWR